MRTHDVEAIRSRAKRLQERAQVATDPDAPRYRQLGVSLRSRYPDALGADPSVPTSQIPARATDYAAFLWLADSAKGWRRAAEILDAAMTRPVAPDDVDAAIIRGGVELAEMAVWREDALALHATAAVMGAFTVGTIIGGPGRSFREAFMQAIGEIGVESWEELERLVEAALELPWPEDDIESAYERSSLLAMQEANIARDDDRVEAIAAVATAYLSSPPDASPRERLYAAIGAVLDELGTAPWDAGAALLTAAQGLPQPEGDPVLAYLHSALTGLATAIKEWDIEALQGQTTALRALVNHRDAGSVRAQHLAACRDFIHAAVNSDDWSQTWHLINAAVGISGPDIVPNVRDQLIRIREAADAHDGRGFFEAIASALRAMDDLTRGRVEGGGLE